MALDKVHNARLCDHRLDRLLDPKLFLDLVSVNTTSATPAFSATVEMITTGLREALGAATTERQQQIVGDLIATLRDAIKVSMRSSVIWPLLTSDRLKLRPKQRGDYYIDQPMTRIGLNRYYSLDLRTICNDMPHFRKANP